MLYKHERNNQLHIPLVKFLSIQKRVIYSCFRIFNNLPPNILQLHDGTMAFNSALRKCLTKNAFHSVGDFLSGKHDTD
jgi:hypothetical protein